MASLQADLRYRKPVFNTENGYEYLKGYSTEKRQVHHTDKVRRSSWRIVCGGEYFAAGFAGSLGHSDVWNRIDAPNQYPFDLREEGAGSQLGYLYEFFTTHSFWKMHPFEGVTGDAVALAEKKKTYVVFLPHGGETTIDLKGAGQMEMKWFSPRTGRFDQSAMIKDGSKQNFRAADKKDWVLLLKTRGQ